MYLSIKNSIKDTLVDDIVGYNLRDFTLLLNKNGYVYFYIGKDRILLHRYIYGIIDDNKFIDHINRDKLDNRYINLRQCIHIDNSHNRDNNKNNTTGARGVSFHKKKNKWISKIGLNMKAINLGAFDNIKDAENAYINANKKYYKEFSPY